MGLVSSLCYRIMWRYFIRVVESNPLLIQSPKYLRNKNAIYLTINIFPNDGLKKQQQYQFIRKTRFL